MTVPRATTRSSLLLALALASASGTARAEGVAFVHDTTIYIDAKEGALSAPEGVACTDSGYLVVADTGNHRLVTYAYKDGRLSGGAEVKLAQLTVPLRAQVDTKGNVLALDGKTRKVVRVGANGTFEAWIQPKDVKGEVVVGAFKLDPSDAVYLLDVAGKRVVVTDMAGKVAREIPLPPESGVVTDIAVDQAGILYAVDAVNAVVWSAEKGATSFKPLTKSLKDRMSFPAYLAVGRGRLFLVDQYGSGIVLLGLDGSYQGRQLSIGWSDGLVNYPAQICLREDGVAFVADRFNNRVQAFTTGK